MSVIGMYLLQQVNKNGHVLKHMVSLLGEYLLGYAYRRFPQYLRPYLIRLLKGAGATPTDFLCWSFYQGGGASHV